MSEMVPPEHLNRLVGGKTIGDYGEIGRHFFEIFLKQGGMKATDRVLDVGCGCGRMAVPLTGYLSGGSYEGFDVVREAVEWCQGNITPRFGNFRFRWADVFNTEYNRASKVKAKDFRFPYRDGEFDFVFLTSVFTHILREDVEHYLREIVRVLKPGGTVMMTFFIWNDEVDRLHRYEGCQVKFPYTWGKEGMRVGSKKHPEAVTAYPEEMVREMLAASGLEMTRAIDWGAWVGREGAVTFQDLIVAKKRG